jgi:hypothetical protein
MKQKFFVTQQLGCRKPQALKKYGLSLLMMGKKLPETC